MTENRRSIGNNLPDSRHCLDMRRVILDYARPGVKQLRPLTWVDWMWPKDWLRLSVYAVLGIFVIWWMLFPKMVSHNSRAQITKAIADIDNIKTALDSFNSNNGRYPTTNEGLQSLVENPANLRNWQKSLDRARFSALE